MKTTILLPGNRLMETITGSISRADEVIILAALLTDDAVISILPSLKLAKKRK